MSENGKLRLAATLPRHVAREPFGEGWRYYFIVPARARQAGCPLQNEGLGTAFEAAVARVEDILLPAFDAWCVEHRIATSGAPPGQTTEPPNVGVYLLLLKGKVVYVGSSKRMPKRVAAHRNGSRPFDQAFYIPTKDGERLNLEATLIRAIRPAQNKIGSALGIPDPAPDLRSRPTLSH